MWAGLATSHGCSILNFTITLLCSYRHGVSLRDAQKPRYYKPSIADGDMKVKEAKSATHLESVHLNHVMKRMMLRVMMTRQPQV